MAKTDHTMTDEELAELLEERGHTGSATSLRQKLTAQSAVAANMPPPPPDEEISHSSSRARLERAFAQGRDGWDTRRARRNDLGGGSD
jgi:hypothetical protein